MIRIILVLEYLDNDGFTCNDYYRYNAVGIRETVIHDAMEKLPIVENLKSILIIDLDTIPVLD